VKDANEARRWLDTAEEDLRCARHDAAGGFFAHACFGAQQAAEKAVKAIHFAGGARTILGHSVRSLIDRLGSRVPALDALREESRELDLYYIPARYPNGLDVGTPGEAFSEHQATRAIANAAAIIAAVRPHVASLSDRS
jgi:HEPN domain-containing protein